MDFSEIIYDFHNTKPKTTKIINNVINDVVSELIHFFVYIENSQKYYLLDSNDVFKKLILKCNPYYYHNNLISNDRIKRILLLNNVLTNIKLENLLICIVEKIIMVACTFVEHSRKSIYDDLYYYVKFHLNIQNLDIQYIESMYKSQIESQQFSICYGQLLDNYAIVGDKILESNNSIKLEVEDYFVNLFSKNGSDNIDNYNKNITYFSDNINLNNDSDSDSDNSLDSDLDSDSDSDSDSDLDSDLDSDSNSDSNNDLDMESNIDLMDISDDK